MKGVLVADMAKLDESRVFRLVYLSVVGLALMCQIVAMATPGWLRLSTDYKQRESFLVGHGIHNTTIELGVNPFFVSAKECIHSDVGTNCAEFDANTMGSGYGLTLIHFFLPYINIFFFLAFVICYNCSYAFCTMYMLKFVLLNDLNKITIVHA